MKNKREYQRGSALIIAMVIIAIFILITAGLFFLNSKNPNSVSSQNTQTTTNINTEKQETKPQDNQNKSSVQDIQQAEQLAELKNTESQIKALMLNFRSYTEIFYSKNNGYSKVCLQSPNLDQVKAKTNNKMMCTDGSDYYVVTAQLPIGGLFCIDSTGYSGKAKSFQTGNICSL